MDIIVCIKEVPDPEAQAENFSIDSDTKKVIPRPGVTRVISPFDENAIEAALQLKEAHDGTVTVITLAPDSSIEALKRGLRMGADAAVLVSNEGLTEPGAHDTAYILARAIEKIGAFDLILCGRQAADWDQGMVGCGIAEVLDIPCVTIVSKIEIVDSGLRVERLVEDGYEIVECPTPALLTLTNEINQPRLTSVDGILRALTVQIPVWSTEEIGVDLSTVGAGLRTRMVNLLIPEITGECEMITGETSEEAAINLVKALRKNNTI